MAADKAKPCMDRHWKVVGGLSIGANPNSLTLPITPKIWDLKLPPSNCGQTAADGATLGTGRRCEVIVVANVPKYSVDSH